METRKERLQTILSHLQSVINDDISNLDYGESPLFAYVNDSLSSLCEFIQILIDYESPLF